jgi:hypothetical protein
LIERELRRDRDGKLQPIAALTHATSAMAQARGLAEQLASAINQTLRDPGLSDGQRLLRSRKLAETLGGTIAKKLDDAVARLIEHRDGIRRTTFSPPRATSARDVAIERQTADVLRQMTDADRRRAITAAIDSEEDTILAAVLGGGPPLLVGLTDAEVAAHRARWRAKAHPDAYDQQQRLERAIEHVERAGKATLT